METAANLKCRTCLSQGTETDILTKVSDPLSAYNETYKDVILHLVPSMEATLMDDDLICVTCRRVLKTTKKFINHCVAVEAKLANELAKQNSEELLETPVIVPVESLENIDLENPAEIVENIEIVVEDDVNQLLQKSGRKEVNDSEISTIVDQETDAAMIDHAYIKTEMEDEDVFDEVEEGEVVFQEQYDSQEAMDVLSETEMEEGRQYVLIDSTESQDEGLTLDQLQELSQDSEEGGGIYIKQEGITDIEDDSSQDRSYCEDTKPFELNQSNMPIGGGVCEVCGKGFKNIQQLNKHLSVHEDKQAQCPNCPKIFRSELYLNRHINLVHKVDDMGLRYLCMVCNKLFKNKGALNAHYKLKHLKLEPYKCEECGEGFGRADYLKKHMNLHKQEDEGKKAQATKVPGKFLRFKNTDEPLPCKICGKYYNGIHKLKVHLQTHVVVKRYACDYCDLTYKRWPSLKRHEKTHLEADGMFYRCNVCWKRMPTQEELQVHMTQHGNPRYRCHVCNQQFHRKYLFDNHYLLEHATPEDLEMSKKEIIYDTLLELANQSQES